VGVGVGVGVGATLIAIFTPLLHTSFFPDLMHVYLKPEEVFTCPFVLQNAPALIAAMAGVEMSIKPKGKIINTLNFVLNRLFPL
jgi:hypothetical protein